MVCDINIDEMQPDASVSRATMGNYLGSAEWTSEDVEREIKEAVGVVSKETQRAVQENGEKFFKK